MTFDLNDAPGGDLSLDDIFGENKPSTTVDTVNEPQTPPVTTPAEPVIKTKTGTVYKSIGDAVEGIEHKDALIAQLREQVRQNTGKDPLSVQRPNPTASLNYTEDSDKYFEDASAAVAKNDRKGYMEIQRKMIWDSLGPLAPTITALSRANAERVVSEQIPDFKGFLASEQYTAVSQDAPLLADAIRSAEANPAAAQQLPELYRVAYLASLGRRVPELIQSARNENTPIPPRPTVQSVSLAPPSSNGTPVVQPSLDTAAGRKATVEKYEAGGLVNQRW